jgi:DNA replication protein DnaC
MSAPQDERSLEVLSNDPEVAGLPGTPLPVVCEFCGAERHTEGLRLMSQVIWFGRPRPCSCPQGVALEEESDRLMAERLEEEKTSETRKRVERLTKESGLSERGLRQTFANFVANTPERAKNLGMAREYAENFSDRLPRKGEPLPGRNGVVMTGAKGTGKTHLAAAIANHLLSREVAVIRVAERDLFDRIRRAYAPGAGEGQTRAREIYERAPLLILDDLGKEKPTDWTLATLYAIIDGRYERALPLVITTNYDTRSLAARLTPEGGDKTTADTILDRVTETCDFLPMTGDSWRGRA